MMLRKKRQVQAKFNCSCSQRADAATPGIKSDVGHTSKTKDI